LESVLAQRLVRTICKKCRTAYEPDDTVLEQINLKRADVAGKSFYYGKGCEECHQTGYKGRKGLYEYMPVNDAIRSLINDRKPTMVLRNKAVEQGMRLLRDDGIRNILDGYTTVEEVLKYT
jgi:type IV pilus assembly protein PilB